MRYVPALHPCARSLDRRRCSPAEGPQARSAGGFLSKLRRYALESRNTPLVSVRRQPWFRRLLECIRRAITPARREGSSGVESPPES
jgi:hypothetical protein